MSLPLSLVERGAKVVVKAINSDKEILRKLRDFGISKDLELSIVSKNSNGSVVVSTGAFKLALDEFLAKRLRVSLL